MKEKSESEDMEWSTEEEVQLLYALDGLKPVGINKHFYMAQICERMTKALKRDIAPDTVWAHLRTWYNLDVLDQMERLPILDEQVEFSLPESEFSALINKKLAETEEKKTIEMASTKPETTTKGKSNEFKFEQMHSHALRVHCAILTRCEQISSVSRHFRFCCS